MKSLLKKFEELEAGIINANTVEDISAFYHQAFGMYDAICFVCSAEIAKEIGYVFDRIEVAFVLQIEELFYKM